MGKIPEFLYIALPRRKTHFGYGEIRCALPVIAYRDPMLAMYYSTTDHAKHSDIKLKRNGNVEIRLTSLTAKEVFSVARSLCTVLPDSFEKIEDREEAVSFRSKKGVFLIPTLEVEDFNSVLRYLQTASRKKASHLTLTDIYKPFSSVLPR